MTYSNSVTNVGTEVAAKIVERVVGGAGGAVAGLVVQPAVWAATGTAPDAGDAFIYSVGLVGTVAGSALIAIPGMATGIVKGLVDDHVATRVDEAKQDEPAMYRNGIAPVGDFGFWASDNDIQAGLIANAGGVAWEHENGALMFIRDASGRLVADYEPASFVQCYSPILPLRTGVNGGILYRRRHG